MFFIFFGCVSILSPHPDIQIGGSTQLSRLVDWSCASDLQFSFEKLVEDSGLSTAQRRRRVTVRNSPR